MNGGICKLSAVPLRAEASERAEMVSQLIFGDAYQILDTVEGWHKIRTADCGYEGWLGYKYHHAVGEQQYQDYLAAEKTVLADMFLPVTETETQQCFPLFAGASIPVPDEHCRFCIGNAAFEILSLTEETLLRPHTIQDKRSTMLDFVSSWLRTPYLWGGRTPAGIDCSGFSQLAYKSIGMRIPRDASQQVELGTTVDFASEAKAGDLAFFQNAEGRIVHVGIVCDKNLIIHASGRVRIDPLDETGVFNAEEGKYTHHLRIIKSLL